MNKLSAVTLASAIFFAAGDVATQPPKPLADLQRARERVPRAQWKGRNFEMMSEVLTQHMRRGGHHVKLCDHWTVEELKALQHRLHTEIDPELVKVYVTSSDNRRQRSTSEAELRQHWAVLDSAVSEAPEQLAEIRRDGLCHEVVLAWAHHVSSQTQARLVAEGLEVPSLPRRRHQPQGGESPGAKRVFEEYKQQVSCQQCHTGTITDPAWQDASLPMPPPVDAKHPGMERQRQCDFQAQPPCGPCEGLGGRRTGDAVEAMTPITCEAIADQPSKPTTRGQYPALAKAVFTGETRIPLAVRPETPGQYITVGGNLSLGWEGDFMRMRYDFNLHFTQVAIQTYEQARNMSTGASVGIGGGKCTCDRGIAGVMHIMSFDNEDPLDPLKLPASEGGVAYLGRVKVTLDGDSPKGKRVAIADHFMKWAFHFLVDADEKSPTFGLPLRNYGPYGVLQVFESWEMGNPAKGMPDIWTLPAGCTVKAPECSVIQKADDSIVV